MTNPVHNIPNMIIHSILFVGSKYKEQALFHCSDSIIVSIGWILSDAFSLLYNVWMCGIKNLIVASGNFLFLVAWADVQVIKGQHNENEVKQANYHYNKAKNLPLVGYPHDAEISLREGAKTAVLSWKWWDSPFVEPLKVKQQQSFQTWVIAATQRGSQKSLLPQFIFIQVKQSQNLCCLILKDKKNFRLSALGQ